MTMGPHLASRCARLLLVAALAANAFAADEPESLRKEFFLLEHTAPNAEPGPIGAVAWRHLIKGDAHILERDTDFREGGLCVREVETDGPIPRATWRELWNGGGRTLLLEQERDQAGERFIRTTTWGRGESVHGELRLRADGRLPLAMLEELRESALVDGTYGCWRPLEGGLIPLTVQGCANGTFPLADLHAERRELCAARADQGLRTSEWRRHDGSLGARFVLRGSEVVAFQWQESDLWARRVDETTYRETLGAWKSKAEPTALELVEARFRAR